MKKLVVIALVLAVLAGGLFAAPKPVIGALIRNLDEQFVADYAANLKVLAAKAGVDLKLLDSRSDQATQLDQLNTLIQQGVKYFVIVPNQTEATEQMAKAIQAVGGGAAFSNIQPSVAALKVGPNFFLASSTTLRRTPPSSAPARRSTPSCSSASSATPPRSTAPTRCSPASRPRVTP